MSPLENEGFIQQIQQLNDYNDQEIDSLCVLCFELLKNGSPSNDKKIDFKNEELIRKLLLYITQAIKHEYSEQEIQKQLNTTGCNAYFQDIFPKYYKSYRDSLLSILAIRSPSNSHDKYVQLNWRFEVKLAGKYYREKFQPYIVLSFRVKNPNNDKNTRHIDIQCTVADIYYIYQKVNEMIEANNSLHCSRLLKNIKL